MSPASGFWHQRLSNLLATILGLASVACGPCTSLPWPQASAVPLPRCLFREPGPSPPAPRLQRARTPPPEAHSLASRQREWSRKTGRWATSENLFKTLHLRDEVQRTIHLHLPPPLSVFTPFPNAWYSREHRSETLLPGIYIFFSKINLSLVLKCRYPPSL